MIRIFSNILFLIFAYACVGLIGSYAQNSAISSGWENVSVCQIRFLIPRNLKNQYAKSIDSCVAEFRSKKIRLAIESGSYGGIYKKAETHLDFKEESIEIDGKKAQVVTYRDTQNKSNRKFVAGFYVVLFEAQNKETQQSAFLYMTIKAKSEKELEIARRIFQSIRFDEYKPFTVEW